MGGGHRETPSQLGNMIEFNILANGRVSQEEIKLVLNFLYS